MNKDVSVFFLSLQLLFGLGNFQEETCSSDGNSVVCQSTSPSTLSKHLKKKYLLYEVNPGEGFNLRRDVYMRIATLVKKLNEASESREWILVLPPWGPLYHWKSKDIGYQYQIKWSQFFDIPSLAKYVPVIEFEEFLIEHGPEIDLVLYLQHYVEGWTDDRWEERADVRECIEPPSYHKIENDKYVSWFWGYGDVYSKEFHCLSIQGYTSTLKEFIKKLNVNRAVMIDRAEVILHDTFGDIEYWMARKSMVFSKKLINIGDAFRKIFLNSTDEKDETECDCNNLSQTECSAIGGPYIAVHLRRLDFVSSRSKDIPSIKHAADQILKHMKILNLQLVFVATDAPESEFKEFQQYIPGAIRFVPTPEILREILDGGVAIVDQWICAHARFFIGTYESTFSFRIHEEREILGFPVEMTFNRLCGNNQTKCRQPAKWTIIHS